MIEIELSMMNNTQTDKIKYRDILYPDIAITKQGLLIAVKDAQH